MGLGWLVGFQETRSIGLVMIRVIGNGEHEEDDAQKEEQGGTTFNYPELHPRVSFPSRTLSLCPHCSQHYTLLCWA